MDGGTCLDCDGPLDDGICPACDEPGNICVACGRPGLDIDDDGVCRACDPDRGREEET